MNEWILPEVKEEIEVIKQHQLIKEQIAKEEFFSEELQPNYVLIDAALWEEDIDDLLLGDAVYRSLFRGSTGEELWSVAPYLVDISDNEGFINLINKKDPINRRVTRLYSSSNIDELRKHLRQFLRMKAEDDTYIYFRFYDPFVINTVFPNFTEEQALDFFAKIEYIITEDHRTRERSVFYLSNEKKMQIKTETIDYVENK